MGHNSSPPFSAPQPQSSFSEARRLFELARRLKAGNVSKSRRVVLAGAFDVPEKDMCALLVALADCARLISSCRHTISALGLKDFYLQGLDGIYNAVFEDVAWHNQWQSSSKHLTDASMALLEATAEKLDEVAAIPQLSSAQVSEISKEAQGLLDSVLASDIQDPLRSIIADHLRAVIEACNALRVRGNAGLVQVTEAAVGAFAINHKLFKAAEENTNVKNFWRFIQHLIVIVPFANGVLELGSWAWRLLPGGDSGEK